MSWSDNRDDDKKIDIKNEYRNLINEVKLLDDLLAKFAKDEDLHNSLKLPIVGKALLHWTNKERQPPQIANIFQKDSNVLYVFQQMKCIQFECKSNPAKNRFMVEHMMQRRKQLSVIALVEIYGEDKCGFILAARTAAHPEVASILKESTNSTEAGKEKSTGNSGEKQAKVKKEIEEEEPTKSPTEYEKSSQQTEIEETGNNTEASSSGNWINTLQSIAMFGYEDPSAKDFTWFKWFLRILIDFAVFGYLSYYFANAVTSHPQFRKFIENRIISSQKEEMLSSGCDNDVGENAFSILNQDRDSDADMDIFQDF